MSLINLEEGYRNCNWASQGAHLSMAFSTLLYIHGTAEHIVECIFQSITSSGPGLVRVAHRPYVSVREIKIGLSLRVGLMLTLSWIINLIDRTRRRCCHCHFVFHSAW